MDRRIIVTAIAVSLLAWTVPTAAADDVVGASGQCFDGDGSGGGGHLAVTDEPGAEEKGLTDVSGDDPTSSAADGVLALVDDDGNPEEGEGCTSEDEDQQDYLEVHAAGQQVCYDGEVRTDGECPHRV